MTDRPINSPTPALFGFCRSAAAGSARLAPRGAAVSPTRRISPLQGGSLISRAQRTSAPRPRGKRDFRNLQGNCSCVVDVRWALIIEDWQTGARPVAGYCSLTCQSPTRWKWIQDLIWCLELAKVRSKRRNTMVSVETEPHVTLKRRAPTVRFN